ncbi:putative protein FAR1-RELATED SEQUENCE 6-like [Capsicum annuum]|nr:putative protein FAR1-RELATED SEQUENCE 6-like [Capsicum annuum]KAF3666481.1 putative protein FAR1-RELATED SEQUENCE 6-like [Capsicum annuum]
MTDSRIMRIARGSGHPVHEVMEMMEEYKRLAKIWSKMKGLKIPKKGEMSALSRNMNAQHMSKVLPPQMLKQIGGMGGLQSLMKQMGSAKDMMGDSDDIHENKSKRRKNPVVMKKLREKMAKKIKKKGVDDLRKEDLPVLGDDLGRRVITDLTAYQPWSSADNFTTEKALQVLLYIIPQIQQEKDHLVPMAEDPLANKTIREFSRVPTTLAQGWEAKRGSGTYAIESIGVHRVEQEIAIQKTSPLVISHCLAINTNHRATTNDPPLPTIEDLKIDSTESVEIPKAESEKSTCSDDDFDYDSGEDWVREPNDYVHPYSVTPSLPLAEKKEDPKVVTIPYSIGPFNVVK